MLYARNITVNKTSPVSRPQLARRLASFVHFPAPAPSIRTAKSVAISAAAKQSPPPSVGNRLRELSHLPNRTFMAFRHPDSAIPPAPLLLPSIGAIHTSDQYIPPLYSIPPFSKQTQRYGSQAMLTPCGEMAEALCQKMAQGFKIPFNFSLAGSDGRWLILRKPS